MIQFTVPLSATQRSALEAVLPEISGALKRLNKSEKSVASLQERLAQLEIEYAETSKKASELVDRAAIQSLNAIDQERIAVAKKIDSETLFLSCSVKEEGAFIGPANETLRAILGPSLTGQLRAAVGVALAPFFNDYGAATAETHRTQAVMKLGGFLNPKFSLRRDTTSTEVGEQLELILGQINALLEGRPVWSYKGVQVPAAAKAAVVV